MSRRHQPPSFLAWSALFRLSAALPILLALWAAVGWALGWWGPAP
jgi:hypothetical protein